MSTRSVLPLALAVLTCASHAATASAQDPDPVPAPRPGPLDYRLGLGPVDTLFIRDEAGRAQAASAGNVSELVASRLPWVVVERPSGMPGEAPDLYLRTPTWVNQTMAVYVDGVRVQSHVSPLLHRRVDPLLALDPERVDRIELARGPVAAARLGSDATAGALLITTRGTVDDPGFHQSASFSVGAATPGPGFGPSYVVCGDPAQEPGCEGFGFNWVRFDALTPSGIIDTRPRYGVRWNGTFTRGPARLQRPERSPDRGRGL